MQTTIPFPKRGFSPQEFQTRLSRAQALMRKHQFDCLFVTAPPNIRYFTGFDSQFWESPTRPWFIVIPLEGEPIAVIPEIGAPEMALTWVKDIRTWPAPVPEDDGLSLLAIDDQRPAQTIRADRRGDRPRDGAAHACHGVPAPAGAGSQPDRGWVSLSLGHPPRQDPGRDRAHQLHLPDRQRCL